MQAATWRVYCRAISNTVCLHVGALAIHEVKDDSSLHGQ